MIKQQGLPKHLSPLHEKDSIALILQRWSASSAGAELDLEKRGSSVSINRWKSENLHFWERLPAQPAPHPFSSSASLQLQTGKEGSSSSASFPPSPPGFLRWLGGFIPLPWVEMPLMGLICALCRKGNWTPLQSTLRGDPASLQPPSPEPAAEPNCSALGNNMRKELVNMESCYMRVLLLIYCHLGHKTADEGVMMTWSTLKQQKLHYSP